MGDKDARRDVIILGGGLVGLTQALALAAHGLTCHVIDFAEPSKMLAANFDGRVSAVASASGKMLFSIGLEKYLKGKGCDIGKIWVSDGLKPGTLDFKPKEDDGALGTMYENTLLRQALHKAATESDFITMHMPASAVSKIRDEHGVRVTLNNGSELTGALLIVAEGRRSPTREEAGIQVARWSYDHTAMICAIHHEHAHESIAYEIFYPAGPFAILPMLDDGTKHRSAIVWTVDRKDAPAMLALSDRAYLAEMEKRMGGFLGKIDFAAPRASFPLGYHHTAKIVSNRLALIGDSAHGIHPIAGQGLNLGFRDVAALTETLVEGARLGLDLGDVQLLKRYDRWRSLDSFMVAASTDALTRLFGVKGRTASAVRRFGLNLVQKTPALKARFMGEARGESGDLPKLLQGMRV